MKFWIALSGLLAVAASSALQHEERNASVSSFFGTKTTPKKVSRESSKNSGSKPSLDDPTPLATQVQDQRYAHLGVSDNDFNSNHEQLAKEDYHSKKAQKSLDQEIQLTSFSRPLSEIEPSLPFIERKFSGLDSADGASSHPKTKIHKGVASIDAGSAIRDFLSIPTSRDAPKISVPEGIQNKPHATKASGNKLKLAEAVTDAPQYIKNSKITSEISFKKSKGMDIPEKTDKDNSDYTTTHAKLAPQEPPKETAVSSPQKLPFPKKIGQEANNMTGIIPPGTKSGSQNARSLLNLPAAEAKPSSPIPEIPQSQEKSNTPASETELSYPIPETPKIQEKANSPASEVKPNSPVPELPQSQAKPNSPATETKPSPPIPETPQSQEKSNSLATEPKPSSPSSEAPQSLEKNVLPVTSIDDKKVENLNPKKNDYTPIIKLAILSSMIEGVRSTTPPSMSTSATLATETSNPPEELSASSTEISPVETTISYESPATTQIATIPTEAPTEDQENGAMGFEACASYQRFCRDISLSWGRGSRIDGLY
ncbi:hypothetical protein DSO57_1023624 [Entomophthora muscae]|uniref:Uncharacterized protein n=1 Tax=Entomophthora muscae TaxID=34485 RepID=A0ACC2UNL5_9FUNG|nr:hypothetical protein DSO57_1023624 [Entomophthora muscae]